MESTFWLYFQLGWRHIVDWAALDHLLFLAALCAIYTLADWRRVLVLVTAFTVGHCLSLVAAGTDTVRLPANWIEALIPATIMLTAVYNLLVSPLAVRRNYSIDGATAPRQLLLIYTLTLFFGLIHGLGFSNTFRALLFPGEEAALATQLLGFNLGIEAGQILVVLLLLVLGSLLLKQFNFSPRYWNWLLSGSAFLIASYLFFVRIINF